jgi:hypothetical protein
LSKFLSVRQRGPFLLIRQFVIRVLLPFLTIHDIIESAKL